MGQNTSRIATIGVLLVATSLLGAAVAAPWLSISWLKKNTAQKKQILTALDRQIADARVAQARERGDDESNFKSLLLAGATAGIAGASLKKLANDLVLGHGSVAQSIQILAPKVDGGLTYITVRLSMTSSTDALREILYKLETSRPLIFVEALTVRVPQRDQQAADRHYLGPLEVIMQIGVYAAIEKAS